MSNKNPIIKMPENVRRFKSRLFHDMKNKIILVIKPKDAISVHTKATGAKRLIDKFDIFFISLK